MKNLLVKFLGPLLAIAGVLGLTGASILWNFQGRALGLPATVLSLLVLAVGVVLLRPLQPTTTAEATEIVEAPASKAGAIASIEERQMCPCNKRQLLLLEKDISSWCNTTMASVDGRQFAFLRNDRYFC